MKDQLENLELENLKMFGESVFNSVFSGQNEKTAKVKTLTVIEGANAKMSNIDITNKVEIGLNAAISLTKVDLSSVSNMEIHYSHSAQYRTPLTGKLGKPPISITLSDSTAKRNSLLLIANEEKFTIASTNKEDFDQCDLWIDSVNIDGTNFEKVECRTQNNARELVAFKVSNGGGDEPKKGSNSTPIIIGVVVAVIVVAIIVIVVEVVIKRKKNPKMSSDPDLINTDNLDPDI